MTDLFAEIEDALSDENFDASDNDDLEVSEKNMLVARRRLEQMLEEKRLRAELEDFA